MNSRPPFCVLCGKENMSNELKTLYSFPKSESEKQKWITNLELDKNSLRYRSRVCNLHFAKNLISSTKLKKGATPTIINPIEMSSSLKSALSSNASKLVLQIQPEIKAEQIVKQQLQKILPKKPLTETPITAEIVAPPHSPIPIPLPASTVSNHTPAQGCRTSAKSCDKGCHRTIANLKKTVKRLKEENRKKVNLDVVFGSNPIFRDLILGQVKRYRCRKVLCYNSFEKSLSLSLYYSCGRQGYNNLLNMGMKLPCLSTLRSWMNDFKFQAGINDQLFLCVRQALEEFDGINRDCILVWDEMSMKEFLEYNVYLDTFEGIVDHGELGRELNTANEVLVVMIQGINVPWKFPISYYFSKHSTTADVLDVVLTQNIEALNKINLNVRAGICDMSFTNQALYRKWLISKTNTFKYFNDSKIHFFHDTPHLIKLIRNNLMKRNFYIDGDLNNSVKWEHIVNFYKKDCRTASRTAPKLTKAHIYPRDLSKMKVKLATQIFSHSVYAGMMSMCDIGILKSEYTNTANFVRQIDEIFDFLNTSRYEKDKLGRCAKYFFENIDKFNYYIAFVESISVEAQSKYPDFLKGLTLTLYAIKNLAIDLKNDGYSCIFTRRLQQDCLEHFFSAVRMKCGYSRNPTARQFRLNFRYLFFTRILVVSSKSNCSLSGNEKFNSRVNNFEKVIGIKNYNDSDELIPNLDRSSVRLTEAQEFYKTRIQRKLKFGNEQEDVVAFYIGGAGINAITEFYGCQECKIKLLTDSCTLKEQLFTQFKEYYSSNSLSYMNEASFAVFSSINRNFKKYLLKSLNSSGTGIMTRVLDLINKEERASCWMSSTNDKCKIHRELMIRYFIRAKIGRITKDRNESIQQIKAWEQTRLDLRNQ